MRKNLFRNRGDVLCSMCSNEWDPKKKIKSHEIANIAAGQKSVLSRTGNKAHKNFWVLAAAIRKPSTAQGQVSSALQATKADKD